MMYQTHKIQPLQILYFGFKFEFTPYEALLSLKLQLDIKVTEVSSVKQPPPYVAVFSANTQFSTITDESPDTTNYIYMRNIQYVWYYASTNTGSISKK